MGRGKHAINRSCQELIVKSQDLDPQIQTSLTENSHEESCRENYLNLENRVKKITYMYDVQQHTTSMFYSLGSTSIFGTSH